MNPQPIHMQIEESYSLSPLWQERLLFLCKWYYPEEQRQIWIAYGIAIRAHQNQRRKSWEAYITHIESVVQNIDEHHNVHNQKITAEDIIVAILHDVIEDHPEYFEEIYRTFGYNIVYRIICLSKPSREVFDKWNRCIPKKQRPGLKGNPVYQLWSIATEIQYPENLAQVIRAQSVVTSYYGSLHLDNEYMVQIYDIMNNIRTEYLSELHVISVGDEVPEKRKKLYKKKWQEYIAALQLLFISVENFRVKFADKIHNLSDIEYRKSFDTTDEAEILARKRKTRSILRTVPIYQFLSNLHQFSWLLPQFQIAVSRSQALDALIST